MRPALLLLGTLLAGCGYVFGGATGDPVQEPSFRVLRIVGGESARDSVRIRNLWLYVTVDGTVGLHAGQSLDEPRKPGQLVATSLPRFDDALKQVLFDRASSPRDYDHLNEPAEAGVTAIPDARTDWAKVRPILATAAEDDVRMYRGGLAGVKEGESVAWRLPFLVARRVPGTGRFATWRDEEPRRFVDLTENARDGIDAAALAARVADGPVLLSAADGVPAQVVADALAALIAAGATPVLLSPEAPAEAGEETLPGIVIR